jgi:hypothetical protein
MSDPSSTTASNGRGQRGRFAPGNRAAKGNPHARRVARFRAPVHGKGARANMAATFIVDPVADVANSGRHPRYNAPRSQMSKSGKAVTKILFIGNSFTARNNLPGLIADLAAARGFSIDQQLLSIGGASLRTHWNKGEAPAAIKSGRFDYVVLQEQSTLPIKNPARMRENVLLFDGVIRGAGSKTALYMTWARKHAPENQRDIAEAYESIGREIDATVIPVGVAWQRFMHHHVSPVLHDKDQSHPTIAGSYLAACVFVRALLGQNALGVNLNVPGLTPEEIKALQEAVTAVRSVKSHRRSRTLR